MNIKRLLPLSIGIIALSSNLAGAQTLKPASPVLYPPLVSEIARLFPDQAKAKMPLAGQVDVKPGASSGAGGFPAQPSSGGLLTGGFLTTVGVLAILGGVVIMLAP